MTDPATPTLADARAVAETMLFDRVSSNKDWSLPEDKALFSKETAIDAMLAYAALTAEIAEGATGAGNALVGEGAAAFLNDLAGRLFRNATPAMGFDQGDTDQLYRIARALANPTPPASVSGGVPSREEWSELSPSYSVTHSPAITGPGACAESWLLDATKAGRGLTTHSTKAAAQKRADEIFGPMPDAIFTIRLFANRTQVAVKTKAGTEPMMALDLGIAALEAERADLTKCPAHKAALPASPSPSGEEVERRARECLATIFDDRGQHPFASKVRAHKGMCIQPETVIEAMTKFATLSRTTETPDER